jgi:hypothetical protein
VALLAEASPLFEPDFEADLEADLRAALLPPELLRDVVVFFEAVFLDAALDEVLPLPEADLRAVLAEEDFFEADFERPDALLLRPLLLDAADLPEPERPEALLREEPALFFAGDLRERDVEPPEREPPFFSGTFSPLSRASDKPIAMACLREVTFFPLRPLLSLPSCISCMAASTFFPAPLEYLAI